MGWLDRFTGEDAPVAETAPEPDAPEGLERPSLGVKALFDGIELDAAHSVLDMGRASESSFNVYGRYARRIRFADLLRDDRRPDLPRALDASVPPQPDRPYDLILAWDLLDRVAPESRAPLVARLAELSAPRARLHVLVDASDHPTVQPFHFTVLDVDRVRYTPAGAERPARGRLLPAEVERLLAPFEVVRAFTSRSGMREYVGILE